MAAAAVKELIGEMGDGVESRSTSMISSNPSSRPTSGLKRLRPG
jgi:hypothetical protein